MNIENIKLIIWDLDETLWNGTLSDGPINLDSANIELLRNLVDCGVMCSICSKNDESQVQAELSKADISDLFVFNSINWSPKGQRVKQIISEMGLREVNVLFIDDNASNRGEVKQFCPNIMVEDVDVISILCDYFAVASKTDQSHLRLSQYKVLEAKRDFKATTASNEDFLYKSNIRVEIKRDCFAHIDRIHDLIQRSNQLNFTKQRDSKEELAQLFDDPAFECGYVTVHDNFGDYGIIGFFALKSNELKHFVFSCRTLNMGVEQYVYKYLQMPSITVIGEVASDLNGCDPLWINQEHISSSKCERKLALKHKVILKGPCDISQIFAYIKDDESIEKEFTYVSSRGINIEGHNHTVHILQHDKVTTDDIERLLTLLPFADENMYTTRMFDDDADVVIFSLFTDPNLGLYREKTSGIVVAFGEWTNDLTDESRWAEYCNNDDETFFLANWRPTTHELETIREHFEFLGRLSPNQIMSNIDSIYRMLRKNQQLFLCLGSEIPYYDNIQEAYADRHEINKLLNDMIRKWAESKTNVFLLDFSKYINGQEDYTNNINHFTRVVYYRMAQELLQLLGNIGFSMKGSSFLVKEIITRGKDILRPIYRKMQKFRSKQM